MPGIETIAMGMDNPPEWFVCGIIVLAVCLIGYEVFRLYKK